MGVGQRRVWASRRGRPVATHTAHTPVTQAHTEHTRKLQEKPGTNPGAHRSPCTSLFYLCLLPLFWETEEPKRGTMQDLGAKRKGDGSPYENRVP